MLQMHPATPPRGPRDRTIRCASSTSSARSTARSALNADIRPGTVSLPKGSGAGARYNGSTSNALVPDTLTDLGGGACFNDARVQVALLGRH